METLAQQRVRPWRVIHWGEPVPAYFIGSIRLTPASVKICSANVFRFWPKPGESIPGIITQALRRGLDFCQEGMIEEILRSQTSLTPRHMIAPLGHTGWRQLVILASGKIKAVDQLPLEDILEESRWSVIMPGR